MSHDPSANALFDAVPWAHRARAPGWIFGGESLQSFAACLTVGCVVGAYSSIFMAPSIYLWLRERFPRRAEAPTTGPSRQDTEQGVV